MTTAPYLTWIDLKTKNVLVYAILNASVVEEGGQVLQFVTKQKDTKLACHQIKFEETGKLNIEASAPCETQIKQTEKHKLESLQVSPRIFVNLELGFGYNLKLSLLRQLPGGGTENLDHLDLKGALTGLGSVNRFYRIIRGKTGQIILYSPLGVKVITYDLNETQPRFTSKSDPGIKVE